MTWLDCRTHESALATLAAATGVTKDRLTAAILSSKSDFSNTHVDPVEHFPREVLGQVGVEPRQVGLDGALLFHGTRLTDPESVRRCGLQPLSRRLDDIWKMLGDLALPEMGEDDWLDFRDWVETGGGDHDGDLYRLKAGDRLHDGPYAVLVKDMLIHPQELGLHDYLDCPEIVQDICRCHSTRFGPAPDLEARFKAATDPCIVTVKRADIDSGAIGAAIWFVRARLLGDTLSLSTSCGFPPRPVAPNDVVAVEVVGEATSRGGACRD